MAGNPKILILDDDEVVLDLYRDLLGRLPSKPVVHTASSGARALALLESEPFSVLLTDLNMPGMDGFQVLTIVRRKFPTMRTVVMTAVVDDQYRTRAYAMGVDLFMEKPGNEQQINLFQDCVESLLGQEEVGGFRGVQSKTMVDLIQLECLSQSSSVLRITNGPIEGRIWVDNGDVIDAEVQGVSGEEAFKKMVSWKTGSFEILPADASRERKIFNSYQGLLLDSAQSLDEAQAGDGASAGAEGQPGAAPGGSVLKKIAGTRGVEFVLSVSSADKTKFDSWGADNAEALAAWVQQTTHNLRGLGEKLNAGQFKQLEALGLRNSVAFLSRGDQELCVGLQRTLTAEEIREAMKDISVKWAS